MEIEEEKVPESSGNNGHQNEEQGSQSVNINPKHPRIIHRKREQLIHA